jgi:hypothetical protein
VTRSLFQAIAVWLKNIGITYPSTLTPSAWVALGELTMPPV